MYKTSIHVNKKFSSNISTPQSVSEFLQNYFLLCYHAPTDNRLPVSLGGIGDMPLSVICLSITPRENVMMAILFHLGFIKTSGMPLA